MGFTATEDAKPNEPHPDGLKCRSCSAEKASEWRGPAPKEYCSKGKCRKAATAAHRALKGTSCEEKLKELDADVDAMNERLEKLELKVDRRTKRHEDQLEEQGSRRRSSRSNRSSSRRCKRRLRALRASCTTRFPGVFRLDSALASS